MTPDTTVRALSCPHHCERWSTARQVTLTMDRGLLLSKIFWNLQANWHFRHRPDVPTLSVQETVGGVAAYTVEWLEDYKELVFEITLDGGVFLINAHGTHRRFSPPASRQIWRRLVEILWWYPQLRGVNIQAGDFVGRVQADGQVA